MKFVVLSGNREVIKSVERYLRYVHSVEGVEGLLIQNPEDKAYENFLVVREWLEGLFEDNMVEIKQTLAFVDLPVGERSEWKVSGDGASALMSLLYLAFPEIYWYFLVPVAIPKDSDECFSKETFKEIHLFPGQNKEGLTAAVKNLWHGYTPLFDPTGFRHLLIHNTLESMKGENEDLESGRPFYCRREKSALVVDEEQPYSYIHAYVAYKFEHRAMVVTHRHMLDKLNKLNKDNTDMKFGLSFEDICLSFPDQAIKYDGSPKHSLRNRDDEFKFFEKIPRRIFVTIGETRALRRENRPYRRQLKFTSDLKFYRMLYKPYAGIFNLKDEARLKPKKKGGSRDQELSGPSSGHAQPGRLGMAAAVLVDRSQKVLDGARCTVDAIYAAVLALQAQEILGGRTATLSINAISLKHQAEVMAECMFYGVEHNFDVVSRFKEIEEELRVIGRWFSRSKRQIMIYNSELNIVNELARVFRQYSQFDEEQKCLNKVRSLNRKIYFRRNKAWGWLVSPLRWYFELLVGSLPRFLAAIVLWPTLFTFVHYWLRGGASFVKSLTWAVNSFFALQVTVFGGNNGFELPGLSILLILLGFFHLGIFISHLYTIVSRR